MITGLPGTGLGLIFFVLSALLSPIIEIRAALRGRSSRARWRLVLNLVLTSLLIVLGVTAMAVTLFAASRIVAPESLSPVWRRFSDALVPVLLSMWAGTVIFIFVGLDLVRHHRRAPSPAPLPEPADVAVLPDAPVAPDPTP